MDKLTSIEICAGGGGQALGLEQAGFVHQALVEYEPVFCETLRKNRPQWNVIQQDVHDFSATPYRGVDLFAGGVPCPPFSKAGKQLGQSDERDLFPQALRLIQECQPRAVMLENVRGLLDRVFDSYRADIDSQLKRMGYVPKWELLYAAHYGVPQLRPRVLCVALRPDAAQFFTWPEKHAALPVTVGDVLYEQLSSHGWKGVDEWRAQAQSIAPTVVGGSKKHGGPDLGPTRAKREWAKIGVDGNGIANEPPSADFIGAPKLTVSMVARIQGFPKDWMFCGGKTIAYRQVGNAFPPPVAQAVGLQIKQSLLLAETRGQHFSVALPSYTYAV